MLRLFVLLLIILLLFVFISHLKNYFTRDNKLEELRGIELEGDLIDIDKEIAEEKSRQQDVVSEIQDIDSQNNIKKEEHDNG